MEQEDVFFLILKKKKKVEFTWLLKFCVVAWPGSQTVLIYAFVWQKMSLCVTQKDTIMNINIAGKKNQPKPHQKHNTTH